MDLSTSIHEKHELKCNTIPRYTTYDYVQYMYNDNKRPRSESDDAFGYMMCV